MSDETHHLALPYLAPAQAQKHVTHNEALRRLDTVVQLAVLDASLAAPPATPDEGDRYIVADGATGDWAGRDGAVAAFVDGAWDFALPGEGWIAYDVASEALLLREADAWVAAAGHVGPFARLGINATADDPNRLAVRSNAVLFTGIDAGDGGTGDMRLLLDREGDGDTASVVFQTGASGRAEIGLAGDGDLVVKVSSDGSAWTEAIRIDTDTGQATIPYDNGASGLTAATVQDALDEIAATGGGGGGAVASVFGRTGTVVAAAGDYDAAEVTVTPTGGIAATDVQAALAELDSEKAPLASPALTGTPTAPTAGGGTNTTQIATTAFVKAALDALVAAAPGALDTLDELAAALGDDASFATTVTAALAARLRVDAAQGLSEAQKGTARANLGLPGRNLLVNPWGFVNQRVAGSGIADDAYGHDRWYALTQTGTIAVSTVDSPEDGTPAMLRLSQSQASAQRMGYAQIVEGRNCRHLRGKGVVLSARARASAGCTLRYAILEWTGTEDAPTSDVVNSWTSGTYTAGNFFLSSNLTVRAVGSTALTANTLADITALTATLGSGFTNLVVFFWTEGTVAQNVTLDLAPQLERGSVATEREVRPIGIEESLCRRYFERVAFADGDFIAAAAAMTSANAFGTFNVASKRVAPSIATSAASTFKVRVQTGAYVTGITSVTVTGNAAGLAAISADKTGGFTASNFAMVTGNAAGFMDFDAEL